MNDQVTNETKAKTASLTKWNLLKELKSDFEDMADMSCGFCSLAIFKIKKADDIIFNKCAYCLPSVRKYCGSHLEKMNDTWDALEKHINETIRFIQAFKPEVAEEE